MAEIHTLGDNIPVTDEPCAPVVKLLEELLSAAKAGEIIGIGVAAVEPMHRIADCFECGRASSGDMMTAVHSLHTRFTMHWHNNVALITPKESS
jgi:hypothetical protein